MRLPWRQRDNSKSNNKSKGKTRSLWEQEFPLVKDGLAEEDVERFVNNLLAKHRAELDQQARAESLAHLVARRLLAEAERDAASLRATAKREGDAEAVRLVAEARQKALEIIEDGKEQAWAAAEQEGHRFLDSAAERAQLIETQAIQMAHHFLIRAREEIRDRIAADTKEVYQSLLSSLQELLLTSQKVEMEWNNKQIEPWWGKPSELKDYQATLLESLMGGPVSSEAPLAVEGKATLMEEAGQLAVQSQPDVVLRPQDPPQAVTEPAAQPESVPAPTLPREERVPTTMPAAERGEPAPAKAEEVPTAILAAQRKEAPPEPAQESRVEPQQAPREERQEESPPRAEIPAVQTEMPVAQQASQPSIGEEDGRLLSRLFSGDVDVMVSPPVSAGRVTALYTYLQSIPDIKILRTSGSWDRGTAVTVTLARPLPLLEMLSKLPVAAVTAGESRKGLVAGEKGKSYQQVTITFKE